MTDFGIAVNFTDTALFKEAIEPMRAQHMASFGNEFAAIASRYVSDPNAIVQQVQRLAFLYFVSLNKLLQRSFDVHVPSCP